MMGVDKMRRKTVATVEKILLRVAIYIRVSTDRQVKEGDSMFHGLLLSSLILTHPRPTDGRKTPECRKQITEIERPVFQRPHNNERI